MAFFSSSLQVGSSVSVDRVNDQFIDLHHSSQMKSLHIFNLIFVLLKSSPQVYGATESELCET